MTRVLVTGAAGLVGGSMVRHAPDRHTVAGVTRKDADLADRDAVIRLFDTYRPEVVVHAAARQAEPERDIVVASANVIDGCLAVGAGLVHLSTDCVFRGDRAPYGEHDRVDPVNAYGRGKAEVEADIADRFPEAAVVRTSLVCNVKPPDPRTAAVLDALADRKPLTLYTDELRCPVRLDDLTAALWDLTGLPPRSRSGVWHLVGPEAVSRYTLGLLIAAWAGLDPGSIMAGSSADAGEPRPADVRLTTRATDAALETRLRPISTLYVPPSRGRAKR